MQRNVNELASYNLARQTAMEAPTEATEGKDSADHPPSPTEATEIIATNKSSLNRNSEGNISSSVEPPVDCVVLLCIKL